MTQRHQLTFRGEAHEIPAGFGLCLRCMRLLTMAQWLDTECEPKEAPDAVHVRPSDEGGARDA
jgi:hypothetical protein